MFVVECNPDIVLVSSLTSSSKRRIKHAGGKSMVIRKLMRTYEHSTGMIDQDPRRMQPPDLVRFRETNYSQRDRILVRHHNQRNNRLIILCPRLEEWIIEACGEANLDPRRYNLPSDPNELHEIINIRINRFEQLVEDLQQRSPPRVRALQTWLRETL